MSHYRLKDGSTCAVRWLIRRDMPEVLAIEDDCFDFAWTHQDFLDCLCQRNCIGMVVEHDKRVVAFMVYELHRSKLHILNFAVHSTYWRLGCGPAMVEKLKEKLEQQRRGEIVLEVRETNLIAQLFFRRHGFQAVGVMRGWYEDTDEDAYAMRFHRDQPQQSEFAFELRNRISEYIAS